MKKLSIYAQERFFKVLTKDYKSAHGGTFDWTPYLPEYVSGQWISGGWTPKVGPSICSTGYHLTSDPLRWFVKGGMLFLCEYDGNVSGDNTDKTSFESVRMLRECDKSDLNIKARLFVLLASGAALYRSDLSGADLSGAVIGRDPCIKGWKYQTGYMWKDE